MEDIWADALPTDRRMTGCNFVYVKSPWSLDGHNSHWHHNWYQQDATNNDRRHQHECHIWRTETEWFGQLRRASYLFLLNLLRSTSLPPRILFVLRLADPDRDEADLIVIKLVLPFGLTQSHHFDVFRFISMFQRCLRWCTGWVAINSINGHSLVKLFQLINTVISFTTAIGTKLKKLNHQVIEKNDSHVDHKKRSKNWLYRQQNG